MRFSHPFFVSVHDQLYDEKLCNVLPRAISKQSFFDSIVKITQYEPV